MKFGFWTIGKNNEPYVNDGINDFTKRISRYYPVSWNIIPPGKSVSVDQDELKKKEADAVLKTLHEHDFLVLLDESGKSFSSVQLASFIEQRGNESTRQVIFLIGGAYGVHEIIRKRANAIWSLSALTFPHQLVRLILAEQIYRACTIIRNEKYHHS